MTVWIKKYEDEIADDYVFSAYLGFKQSGRVIKFFTNPEEINYQPHDVVVGSVQDSHYIFKKIGVTPPNFYIPSGSESWAGRTIERSNIKEVKRRKSTKERFFVKPINTKEFPAQIVDSLPLITYRDQHLNDEMECWTSEIINFVTEYRVFIIEKEIVGCQYYCGDFSVFPNWESIKDAINAIKHQPLGWCIDFGIDDTGRTLLIEANDGYAIGDYGLYPSTYSKLLEKRWKELTSVT